MSSTNKGKTTVESDTKVTSLEKAVEAEPVIENDDDEFEEFPVQDYAVDEKDSAQKESTIWEDNWDDESAETEFSKQLKEELQKHGR